MGDLLDQFLQRPARYAYVDGTSEMSFGLMFLGFALMGYLQAILPEASIWRRGFHGWLFMQAIPIPFFCLSYFGGKAIKKYITYPRTGYAVYRRPKRLDWAKFVLIGLGLAACAAVIFFSARHMEITQLRVLLVIAVASSYSAFGIVISRMQRWKWFVYGPLAVGLTVMLLVHADFPAAAQRGALLAGCTYLASGAASLYLYMRQTQVPGGLDERLD